MALRAMGEMVIWTPSPWGWERGLAMGYCPRRDFWAVCWGGGTGAEREVKEVPPAGLLELAEPMGCWRSGAGSGVFGIMAMRRSGLMEEEEDWPPPPPKRPLRGLDIGISLKLLVGQ
jgi:hypothetical protein